MDFTKLDILLITQRDLLTNPLPYLPTPFYVPRPAFMAYGPRFVAEFNGRAFDYCLFNSMFIPPPAVYLTCTTIIIHQFEMRSVFYVILLQRNLRPISKWC